MSKFRFLGFYPRPSWSSPAPFRTYISSKLWDSDWRDHGRHCSLSGLYQSLQSGRSRLSIRVPSCLPNFRKEQKTWIRFLLVSIGSRAVAMPPPELGLRSGVWGYAEGSSFFDLSANKASTSGGNSTQASFRSLYSSAVTYLAKSSILIFPRWIIQSLVNLSNPS